MDFSASHLTAFLECHYAAFLDLNHGKSSLPGQKTKELFTKKGLEHETKYLECLKEEGKSVVEIDKINSSKVFNPIDYSEVIRQKAEQTKKAMQEGVDVIYHATFYSGKWQGEADFLIKCDKASSLGDYSYEVLDAKLKRTAEPKHIIQLCVYTELLTQLQETQPEHIHLFLGDEKKYSFKVSDFFFYYLHTKEYFTEYVRQYIEPVIATKHEGRIADKKLYPEPCSYCGICVWKTHCEDRWKKDNHLSLVAGMQGSQAEKLRKAGVYTVKELAHTTKEIPHLNEQVFSRLKAQAVLQNHKAVTGQNKYELIDYPEGSGKSFERLPSPDKGDLFFDMEGDPLYPNGLEYLFGLFYQVNEKQTFESFWAQDPIQEKQALIDFMAFIDSHLRKYPEAHIYHYNHYETTALKRLVCRYVVCEEQMDQLLRQQKFVDLYLVVREGVRTSEPGYSIKNLETFYMKKRTNQVTTAEDSILMYNKWRETGNDQLLKEIELYNREDCRSTYLLRNWLLTLKPPGALFINNTEEKKAVERKDWEIEYEKYQEKLKKLTASKSVEHLSHLLEFHKREEKSQWWAMFDRQNKTESELLQDTECIAGLKQIGQPCEKDKSLIYTYQFLPQDHKLKTESGVVNVSMKHQGDYSADNIEPVSMKSVGTLIELNDQQCRLKIKVSKRKKTLPECFSIGPDAPIRSAIIRKAIYEYADDLLQGDKKNQVAMELLDKKLPRIKNKRLGEPILISENLKAGALEVVSHMDRTYLFIQGPPGTGKTYTCGHIITGLIQQGKTVGVASNSHKAIHNLLRKVEDVAVTKDLSFRGMKKASQSNKESFYEGKFIKSETDAKKIDLHYDLYAGTAWFFSNECMKSSLDYLFIDEAGQVSLANVVAMSAATKNLVLVGDHRQLAQPIQGVHPGEAGLSVLEFLLEGQSTVSPDRGIFLDESYRLCPAICRFISDSFYDSRLKSHKITNSRKLKIKDPDMFFSQEVLKGLAQVEDSGKSTASQGQGILMVKAHHTGCSQKSVEEGEIIKRAYNNLLNQEFQDKDGNIRSIAQEDILVMTPYNVQVNYLQSLLPRRARVGTVDKFQGQEAPVVLISMVTSSSENLSRNMEFLYSNNRLNVALSRAQCLAVLVMNPELLRINCNTVDQMKLVNTFCRLEDYTGKQI